MQTGPLFPAVATGEPITVITTLLLFVQPLAMLVSTSVYVVVTKGDATGFATVELNPAGTELH